MTKHRRKGVTRCVRAALWVCALLLLAGCEDGGPGSALPDSMTGPGGQSVEIVGLSSGSTVACRQAGSDVWTFSVGYNAAGLDARYTAQLLVEVTKDTSGGDVWGSSRGPYVQSGSSGVGPGAGSGSLAGRIGPPVSESVRFNVAVQLVDGGGQVIAVSGAATGLKPRPE